MKNNKVEITRKVLNLRDNYQKKRHKEHMEFMKKSESMIYLRFNLGTKLVRLKDMVASKRFKEQMQLLEARFSNSFALLEKELKSDGKPKK